MIGEPAPTYWIVRDIVRSLPSDLRALAQHGSRRFGELYDLVHRREAFRPNALWQADHTQLDKGFRYISLTLAAYRRRRDGAV